MSSDAKTIGHELSEIAESRGGTITPAAVLEYARNPDTRLHRRFEWDDSVASEKFRLLQAAKIIRVNVTYIEGKKTRQYVSLTHKRGSGEYREIVAVMSVADSRAALLKDALAELAAFKRKYAGIRALAGVFAEIDKVGPPQKMAG